MAGERKISTRLVLEGEREYRAAISDVNREYRLLQSQMKLVDSEFAGQKNSIAALEAKNKTLNAAIANQTEKFKAETEAIKSNKAIHDEAIKKADEAKGKLDALKSSTDEATKGTQEYKDQVAALEKEYNTNTAASEKAAAAVDKHAINANNAQAKINELNGELKNNEKYLDEARNSADGTSKSIDEFGKEAKTAGEKAGELGEKGSAGINALAAALAAAGITATVNEIRQALEACIETATTFEASVAKIATLADTSITPIDDISSALLELSNETGQSAASLAESVYQAISAGVDTAKSVGFVGTATKLAVGGFTDSTAAVDVLTTAINAYKLSADDATHISNVLLTTQNLGKTTVAELASEMGSVIPIAAAYNVSLEDLSTGYAEMTKSGINTANASTYLRSMINSLGDSSSEVAGILMDQTGKSFAELEASGYSLGDILQIISDSVNGDSTAFANLWGNVRAGLGALSLLNTGSTQYNKTLSAMQNSTGATAKAYDTMASTAEHANKKLSASVDNLKIAIGDQLLPALTDVDEIGADVVQWASDFTEQNEWLAPAITGVVAALGAMSVSVVAVTVVIPALQKAWIALQGSMGAIGWISLAVGAIAGIGVAIANSLSSAKQSVDDLADSTAALPEAAATAQQEYEQKISDLEATKEKADTLVDTLSGLEAGANAGTLDVSEWAEWNDTLAELVETVPELSQYISLQTGEIEGGTAALKEHINALDAEARKEAATSALSSLYSTQATAYVEMTQAQADYDTSYQSWQTLVSKRIVLLKQLSDAGYISADSIQQLAESGDWIYGPSDDSDSVLWQTVDALNATSLETMDANESAAQYSETLKKSQDEYNATTDALNTQKDALYALGDATDDAGDKTDGLTQAQSDAVSRFNALKTQLDDLTTAYNDAYTSALQSINGIVSGFNEITMPDPENINDLIAALNSQNIYLNDYSDNLLKLQQMAESQGLADSDAYQTLVDMLSDGSVESAANLAAIVSDGGENLQMLLTQVDEISQGKETFATIVATMQTDFEEKSTAIQNEMKTLADNLNQSTAAGDNVKATMDAVTAQLSAGASTIEGIVSRINAAIASIGKITYTEETTGYNTGTSSGSHAQGLAVVPADGSYNLHADEMILSKLAAQAYRAEQSANYSSPIVAIQEKTPVSSVLSIDYAQLGASVASAMAGMGITMDGEKVGALVSAKVSQTISEEAQGGRYS